MKYKIISWSNGRTITSLVEDVDTPLGKVSWLNQYIGCIDTHRVHLWGQDLYFALFWHKQFVKRVNESLEPLE